MHNQASELPALLATPENISGAEEPALREAVERFTEESSADLSFFALRTECTMALLSVKYEHGHFGENTSKLQQRKALIMAETLKTKLNKDLAASKAKRVASEAAAPVKAPKAPKAPKDPAATAPRGRVAAVNKIRSNPEGGTSKLMAGSERAAVMAAIKAAGAKGITVADLDAQFEKPTRGFVLKLLEKGHVLVLG